MRFQVMFAVAFVAFSACAEPSVAPNPSASASIHRRSLASLESPDAFAVAVQYVGVDVVEALPVPIAQFAANEEAITDAQFEAIGAQMVDSNEEAVYQDDGIFVEWVINQGGGSGGGGGDEEMMSAGFAVASADDSFGTCEDLYERITKRCGRIITGKGRAACWAAAMVVYAACRADME